MSHRVIVSGRAEHQLDEATAWYAERDLQVASQWYYGFRELFETLAENPDRHALAHESHAFPYEVREILYGSRRK